jgi:hypothetical protein
VDADDAPLGGADVAFSFFATGVACGSLVQPTHVATDAAAKAARRHVVLIGR